VSKAKLTSTQQIAPPVLEGPPCVPEPDWSLIKRNERREDDQTRAELKKEVEELTESLRCAHIHSQAQSSIIEGAHAQLVVQDMYLGRLNESLNLKENKPSDRTRLFPEGGGRLLTEDRFAEELANDAAKKKMKAAAQEQGQAERAARKATQNAVSELWKVRCQEHKQAVCDWEAECSRLRADGVLKKNLPKRPPRVTKADVRCEIEAGSDSDNVSQVSGDEEGFEDDE
jgi:hypothetical protein